MEGLTLSQQEQICYGELFQNCDVDGTGRITGVRASDLFLSSGLSQDHLMQVTELCGAKRLGHFGRSQFYIALKLIAAAQLGLPVKLDSLNTGKDIPLPKFTRQNQNDIDKRLIPPPQSTGTTQELSVADRPPVQGSAQQPMQTAAGQLPPPPANKKSHSRNLSGQYRTIDQQGQINSRDDSPHNAKSPPFSPKQSPPSSPPVIPPTQNAMQPIPTASTIPAVVPVTANQNSFPTNTPTVIPSGAQATIQTGPSGGPSGGAPGGYVANSMNSTHEAGWASFEDEGSECHGLLGTGPKKTYNLEAPGFDSSSISSDPESVDDIWSINEEQRDYYVKQFQIMQPDLGGAILGGIAKDFFEKSKLPVHELSKIWQLSDLNRDGALSLEEFCIAMHLVVLRRNDIELPDRLPFSLMPYSAFTNEEPFAADLPPGSTLKRTTPPSSPPAQQSGSAHWAQSLIQESPQTSSEMSSPSIKPANFEFSKPVPSDPEAKIVHPVAVRMSPESQRYPPEGVERGRAFSEPAPLVDTSLPDQSESLQAEPNMSTAATTIATVTVTTKQRSNTETSYTADIPTTVQQNDTGTGNKAVPAGQGPIALVSRPRPVPKKANQVPGGVSGLLIPVPVSSQPGTGEGTADRPPLSSTHSLDNVVNQEPPRPPPRPGAQPHGRSLSVDLIGIGLSTPPAVPPRTSPKDSPAYRRSADGAIIPSDKKSKFPEFKKFESIPSQEVLVLPDVDSVDGNKSAEDLEKTRRNLSKDYTKLEPSISQGPESGDGTASAGGVKVTSPGVTFDLPSEEEAGGGEKQRAPIFAMRQVSRDKKDLQMAIRTHKERNTMLERLNSELNQELQEVMEQRIALEIQLEHLKPFTS